MNPATPAQADPASLAGDSVRTLLRRVADAQLLWADTSLRERRQVVRRARRRLVDTARALAEASAASRGRPVAEVLSAELLPLVEAFRWAEQNLESLLKPQQLGSRGRPLWLGGVRTEIRREPRGTVLIVAPSNYPLLLPGVQLLQALAAGNGVLLKPAPGTAALARMLCDTWEVDGLPLGLLELLPESPEAAQSAIREGVDLVVLTGSAEAGEAILRSCAERTTPAVAELSGCDVAIVRDDADIELTAAALAFGMRLNGGATCIAPRRVLAARRVAEPLEAALVRLLGAEESHPVPPALEPRVRELLNLARDCGASVLAGGEEEGRLAMPLVISGGNAEVLLKREIFASVLTMTFVDSDEQALTLAGRSDYALGATIFSRDENAARALAGRLNAGVVVINDMIVPTADPRIPFGGRGRSGFGVTRGAEGLLTMTVSKVVTSTPGRERRHFQPVGSAAEDLFSGYLQVAHGSGWKQRWAGLRQLWRGLRGMTRRQPKRRSAHMTSLNE